MRRLLLEEYFIKQILDAQDSLSVGQAKSMLRRWFVEDKGATEVILEESNFSGIRSNWIYIFWQAYLWENNEPLVEWLENQKKSDSTVCRNIYAVKKDAIISQIQKALEVSFLIRVHAIHGTNWILSFYQECPEVALDAVVGLCQALSPAHRGEVVKTLSQLEFTEKEHTSMGWPRSGYYK